MDYLRIPGFSEDYTSGEEGDISVPRSPSRLDYIEIPINTDRSLTSEGSQEDTAQDNLKLLDLEDTADDNQNQGEDTKLLEQLLNYDNRENGHTITRGAPITAVTSSSPITPVTSVTSSATRKKTGTSFIATRNYIKDKGHHFKSPYERTVYVVKTVQGPPTSVSTGLKCDIANVIERPISATKTESKASTVTAPVDSFVPFVREDSGYSSRLSQYGTVTTPKTFTPVTSDSITLLPREDSARSSRYSTANSTDTKVQVSPSPRHKMSYYTTTTREVYGNVKTSSTRLQEKEELQKLNDRFTSYVLKVRQLSDRSNQLDSATFIKSTRALEEEVSNLKNLYEKELENIRHELEESCKEKNNYQIQCGKSQQAAIDLENRLSVECDKNRRLLDDVNTLQRNIAVLETELGEFRSKSVRPQDEIKLLQRELDKLTRENADHKRRHDKETIMRQEAEDKVHSLMKKLEFNEQVHANQMQELHERLESSTTTILSLEGRMQDIAASEPTMSDIMKQVRETAEVELRRYQAESEEQYNRNITALKAQMDNDASRLERMSDEKCQLEAKSGEFQAKIRALEGQIRTLEHQKISLEELLKQEREKATAQMRALEVKLRDMQELVFSKMREASSLRDINVPLKAEIEAIKTLLEQEERRLSVPVQTVTHTVTSPLSMPPYQQTGSHQHYTRTSVSETRGRETPVHAQTSYSMQTSAQTQGQAQADTAAQSSTAYQTTALVQNVYPTAPPESLVMDTTQYSSTTQEEQGPPIDVPTTTKYTYETTPSMNRLQIEASPTASPRPIGPISRVKSAPAGGGRNPGVQLIPTALGHGKDYFDEMFKDLTKETLYSPVRPKSSPTDRPPSSVYHDYTTSTSSAIGDIKILEVNQEGKYVRLVNEGKTDVEFGGFMIQQNVGGHPVAVYRFPPRTKFASVSTITVWSGSNDHLLHQPPTDYVWKEQQKWGTGPECTTILCKPNGQAIAWTTAAHRFTQNAFEDTVRSPSETSDVRGEGETVPVVQEETLTELNVNINEPKPDPVYLRREKQQPPSLAAQKHPHGNSPGTETHPHTGQPRPLTYGNDNSSVNRQSRSQTTRPDPFKGQPYAGSASAHRMGSAPLRKSNTNQNGNIRSSGALANRSNPGVTSEPPNPFMPPHKRFEMGLAQLQSQQHEDFLPPMPRPPLFSAW